MSARQNKKRKGRNNVNNRERTVTTFTEDPNTSFLVPLSSEEPAGSTGNLMSSPFSVTSSSGGNNNVNLPSGFQLAGNFSIPYNYMAPIHAQQQQQQQFYQQPPILPPGKNDLEILENLKTMIKDGQHELYRAVPQPAALASLYMGPTGGQSQVPPHPEQIPADLRGARFGQAGYGNPNDVKNLYELTGKTALDNLLQSMNNSNEVSTPVSAGSKHDATPSKSGTDTQSAADAKPTAGLMESDNKPRDTANGDSRDNVKSDQTASVVDRAGEYNPRPPVETSSGKSTYDAKDDSRLPRESSWNHHDAPLDDRRGRYDDRNAPSQGRSSTLEARPNSNDSSVPPSGDRRYSDRDRDRDRDRERDRDWERDRAFDRDRDRRPEFFGRSYGRSHAPRPPPELRHYEPSYASDYPPRRYDRSDFDHDRRGGIRNSTLDDRRPLLDDKRPPPPPPLDDRPSRVLPPVDDRDRSARPPLDDRPMRPLPASSDVRPARSIPSDELPRPTTGAAADDRPTRIPTGDDRGVRAPIPSDEQRTAARPPVTLEERISQAPPSLQDRLSQPGVVPARVDISRQPSLEERLSHAPVTAAVAAAGVDRPLADDRSTRPGPVDPPRATLSDRPADRFARPITPPLSRTSPYVAPARAPSVARDDLRAPPPPKDAVVERDMRDFRTSRNLSRERADVRPPYQSDLDRSFTDDRREVMDVDVPPSSRFADPRGPPRRFSPPPSVSDRGRGYFPARSPPPARDSAYDVDSDRRYAASERDAFDRRRDWYDEESRRPPTWRPYERPPSDRFADRDRDRERDLPPGRGSTSWEDRERERRAFPPSPSRVDSGASRSLSSRLTDAYPAAGSGGIDDRYAPPSREFDRSRYDGVDPPPFSRIRGRSPSPPRRANMDDLRPPLKRPREDVPPYGGSAYGNGNNYSPPRRSSTAGDYPPRSNTPPPGSSGSSSFYERGAGGPPPFSGGSSSAGDRDYGRRGTGGNDLPPYGAPYDRDARRSPPPLRVPPSYGRYARPGDPRDDRRYMPPPPPPRTS